MALTNDSTNERPRQRTENYEFQVGGEQADELPYTLGHRRCCNARLVCDLGPRFAVSELDEPTIVARETVRCRRARRPRGDNDRALELRAQPVAAVEGAPRRHLRRADELVAAAAEPEGLAHGHGVRLDSRRSDLERPRATLAEPAPGANPRHPIAEELVGDPPGGRPDAGPDASRSGPS